LWWLINASFLCRFVYRQVMLLYKSTVFKRTAALEAAKVAAQQRASTRTAPAESAPAPLGKALAKYSKPVTEEAPWQSRSRAVRDTLLLNMSAMAIRKNLLRLLFLFVAGLTHPDVAGTQLMASPVGEWLSGAEFQNPHDLFYVVLGVWSALVSVMLCMHAARPFKSISAFIEIIRMVMVRDVIQFGLVALVLLAGFSLALQTTYREPDPNLLSSRQPLTSVGHVFMELILLLFGHMSAPLSMLLLTDENEPVRGAVFPVAAFGLLLAYLIVVQLVLLNLLIAYMGMTLAEIHADATNHSHWQFAAFVLQAESHVLGNWPRSPCYKRRQYERQTLGNAHTHAGGRALYIDGSIRLPAWWSDQPEANLEPVGCKFLEIELLGDARDRPPIGVTESGDADSPKHAVTIMTEHFKVKLAKDRDADHPSSCGSLAVPAHPYALAGNRYNSAARTRAGMPKLVGYGSSKNLLCGATVGLAQSSQRELIPSVGGGQGMGEEKQPLDATLASLIETLRAEMRQGIDEQIKDVASSAAAAAAAAIQAQFQSEAGATPTCEGAPIREKESRQGSLTHAAATSLIAKLVRERDEARAMLSRYRGPDAQLVPHYQPAPTHRAVTDRVRQLRPLAPLQPVAIEPEDSSGGGLLPRRENGLREGLVAPGGGASPRREESPRDALARRRERWVRNRASGEVARTAVDSERSDTPTSAREPDYRV
jgi:hypothetical protein